MGRITLWGFYQYDPSLFDDIVLPQGMVKDDLICDIMRYSGDLYPYHQVPSRLKVNITSWFSSRYYDFNRIYEALRVDYSPIENYDRTETTSRNYENSGSDKATTTLGSSNTMNTNGTNTNVLQVSAYNAADFTNREGSQETYQSTQTNSSTGSDSTQTDYGLIRKESEDIHVHGNIGLTSNQQMVESEISLRTTHDVYKMIAMEFEHEFLVQIY